MLKTVLVTYNYTLLLLVKQSVSSKASTPNYPNLLLFQYKLILSFINNFTLCYSLDVVST